MAECYLHFWLRFRVKYLRSNEQSLNLVVKNWNNKCRQIIKKKVIFLPEFPFKPLFKVYNSIGNELSDKVMMTFIVSRLQSGTKTKLKHTNKQNKTQDKYFTT